MPERPRPRLSRPRLSGAPHLSEEQLSRASRAMEQAWRSIKQAAGRQWGQWHVIGDGFLVGRTWAQQVSNSPRPEGRAYNTAYSEWLRRYHVHDIDKSVRACLLKCMEEWPAIEEWRATLTEAERRRLNHPTTVWRKFNAGAPTPPSRPRRNASRALIELEQSTARVVELTQELQTVRSQDQPSGVDQLVDALIGHIEQGVSPQLKAAVLRLLQFYNHARRRSRQRQMSDAVH